MRIGLIAAAAAAAAATVALTACATSTGVVPIGDGIYMLGTHGSMSWSGSEVKAGLYKEAGEFCAKQGKQVSPVSDSSRDAAMYSNYASAEIKFRCS